MTLSLTDKARSLLQWFKRSGEPIDVPALLKQETASVKQVELLASDIRWLRYENRELKIENEQLTRYLEMTATETDQDVPSITKQTPWKCGFYSFGPAKRHGDRFFNLANVLREDGEWLVARRARPMEGTVDGMNDLVAFKLNADRQVVLSYPVKFPKRYKDEHYEDPRISIIGGEMYVAASTFHKLAKTRWALVHQVLGKLSKDWIVQKLYDPIYGNNGGSPLMQTGFEKNWLWFEHAGKPHCVYSNLPHVVVEWDDKLKAAKAHKTRFHNPLWKFGEVRGGTPPVQVGNEYFSFFHSSTPWLGKKRRYHMGLYAFEAHPPFRITRMSTLPILSGSKDDPWYEGLPLVVFPCGALLRNGVWTVTLGVNDCESAWIEIPHAEVTQTLRDTQEIDEIALDEVKNPTVRKEYVPDSLGGEASIAVGGDAQRVGEASPRGRPTGIVPVSIESPYPSEP